MGSAPEACLKAELALLQNSSALVDAVGSTRTEIHRRNSLDLAVGLNVKEAC
jgi:hypothetical protein